jgi:CDP-diacylglycerol--glycerol-3-phosphate 3-phosphatidyltransferase
VAETLADPVAQFKAKETFFTPANLISLMRAMMVFPAIFAIMAHLNILAASIFVTAFLSDLADGLLARKMNDVSEWGKVIDPLADKIFVGFVVLAMAYYEYIPWWFVVAILARDIVIVLAGIWATRKFKVVLPSNYPGKAAVLVISVTLFLIMAGLRGTAIDWMQYASIVLMAVSLVMYAKRLFRLLRAVPVA